MAGPDDNSWWQQDQQAPTGDAFLATKDPARAAQIKAMAEGRQAIPAGYSMRSPYAQQLLADVAQYDPSFDAANLPSRIAARKAFTSGKQGQGLVALNTAIGHTGTLAQAIENLNNGSFPAWNGIANTFETATGDPRVTNFNLVKQAAIDEAQRVFKQTGGNVHEIAEWEQTINSSRSPAQLRGAVAQLADLYQSRIGALHDSYNTAMGTTDQPLPMLNQHATDTLPKFQSPDYLTNGYSAPIPPVAGGGTPGNPPGTPPPTTGGPATPPSATPGSGGPGTPVFDPGGGQAFSPDRQQALSDDRTGGFHQEFDPKKAAAVEAAIRGGASQAEIEAAAGGPVDPHVIAAARSYLKSHPSYTGFVDSSMWAPNSTYQNLIGGAISALPGAGAGAAFINGAGDAASFGLKNKIGAGVTALADRVGGDNRSFGDIYNDHLASAEIGSDALSSAHPIANLAGETAGFIGGDALLGAGTKAALGSSRIAAIPDAIRPALGDALYGGAYGAGSSDSLSDVPGNVVRGAALGATGGVLGRGAVKGVSAALSPVANAAVQRLTDAGVTLTPGQILGANGGLLGSFAKSTEDRLAGFPGVGDVINNARRGGVEDFNKAAINDALSPIGESVDGVGHGAIKQAQQKVSDAYTSALSGMSAVPDQQLTTDLRAVGQKAQALSPVHRQQLQNILDTDLQPYLNGKSRLDGEDLQNIKQGLDKRIARLSGTDGSNASPQDKDLADSLSDVRDAIVGVAARTDPSSSAAFQNADEAYAKLSRVNGAAAKSNDGVFTPNQFKQAVSKRGYGTTTNKLARGDGLMQQLSSDASTVLPSKIADSGTAGRGVAALLAAKAAGMVPGAALGAGTGYLGDGAEGALGGAIVGAGLYSRPGLKAAQYLLAGSRGPASNTLGDLLRRNAALGGAVGTPLLLQNLPK